MSIITKIFGTRSEREVKKLLGTIEKIEALDEKFSAMTEKELRGMTAVLNKRLADGESLDDILPEAFATVRESAPTKASFFNLSILYSLSFPCSSDINIVNFTLLIFAVNYIFVVINFFHLRL